eukprot:TRINITY_DN21790_c0_g1_i1.p1 TRINITY_DN21790_c0_g1~~TRINITY_DN21790_c0_g1_i1.p1  ORF type:complete len:1322 (+),score=395.43 TRINITY_DN21790_c0_g1_i1:50-3967(+)
MPGKKKVKKLDPSMYSTASKPKEVRVTKEAEEKLKEIVDKQTTQIAEGSGNQGGKASLRTTRMISRLVGKLLKDGFKLSDIESGLRVGIAKGGCEKEIDKRTLDWLCSHVTPLPSVFAVHVATTDVESKLTLQKNVKKPIIDNTQRDKETEEKQKHLAQQTANAQTAKKQKEDADRAGALEYILSMQDQEEESDEDWDAVLSRNINYGSKAPDKGNPQSTSLAPKEVPILAVPAGLTLPEEQAFITEKYISTRLAASNPSATKDTKSECGKMLVFIKNILDRYELREAALKEAFEEEKKKNPQEKKEKTVEKPVEKQPESDDDEAIPFDMEEECEDMIRTKLPIITDAEMKKVLEELGFRSSQDIPMQPKTVLQKYCSKHGYRLGFKEVGSKIYSVDLTPKKGSPAIYEDEAAEASHDTVEGHNRAACHALFSISQTDTVPYFCLLPETNVEQWREYFINHQLQPSSSSTNDLPSKIAALYPAQPPPKDCLYSLHRASADSTRPVPSADTPLTHEEQRVSNEMIVERKNAKIPETIRKVREGLPAAGVREEILGHLKDRDMLVVAGETGCGKTTQVPQYILDSVIDAGEGGRSFVICTQPRRLAATSVATRVSDERGEERIGGRGSRVGYHVRFDATCHKGTRLLFCTTGILMRRLAGNKHLANVSHVIIDEVHERSLEIDFLLSQLREISFYRRSNGLLPLKVILMSATVDPGLFSTYCNSCPIVTVSGRTFPVTTHFLEDVYDMQQYELDPHSNAALKHKDHRDIIDEDWETDPLNRRYKSEKYESYSLSTRRNISYLDESQVDYDLIVSTVTYIDSECSDGAVLVFLSGFADICNVRDMLKGSKKSASWWVIPLHSTIPQEEQQQAFVTPPEGTRKIVLATNIAETSITVNDVVYVVDTGKVKQTQYDATTGLSSLKETWISKANGKQRRGRAGRVQPGTCFALYTADRHSTLDAFETPEISRVPLTEICLNSLVLYPEVSASEMLAKVIQPPPEPAVEKAVSELHEVGAMYENQLTVLGKHLAGLPVDVKIGKLLLISVVLGVVSPALTVAAVLGYKSPFMNGSSAAKKRLSEDHQSDHLAFVKVYDGWVRAKQNREGSAYCRKHMVSVSVLEMIRDLRKQLAFALSDGGLIPKNYDSTTEDAWWNGNQAKPNVLKAALCFALDPNVATVKKELQTHSIWLNKQHEVFIHQSSALSSVKVTRHPYIVYHTLINTSKAFATDCTVLPLAVLLIFSSSLDIVHRERGAWVDEWLWVPVPASFAVMASSLRTVINTFLTNMLDGAVSREATAALAPVVAFLEEN